MKDLIIFLYCIVNKYKELYHIAILRKFEQIFVAPKLTYCEICENFLACYLASTEVGLWNAPPKRRF